MGSIVTKRGDSGFTDRLFGEVIRKDSLLVDAIGNLDELNAIIGLAAKNDSSSKDEPIKEIQNDLVNIMGELSSSDSDKYLKRFPRVYDGDIDHLEYLIHKREEGKTFNDWATPSSEWDVACRVCRRAERSLWRLHFNGVEQSNGYLRKEIVIYINRLSDYLWILGRN